MRFYVEVVMRFGNVQQLSHQTFPIAAFAFGDVDFFDGLEGEVVLVFSAVDGDFVFVKEDVRIVGKCSVWHRLFFW